MRSSWSFKIKSFALSFITSILFITNISLALELPDLDTPAPGDPNYPGYYPQPSQPYPDYPSPYDPPVHRKKKQGKKKSAASTCDVLDQQVYCMATVLWAENGSREPDEGVLAVGSVIVNRGGFGYNVCAVTEASDQFAHSTKCSPRDIQIATGLLNGTIAPYANIIGFYNPNVPPKGQRVCVTGGTQIGHHLFYTESDKCR